MKFLKLMKRWSKMLFGNSSFHVEQPVGKCYSKTELRGYYNDLTNKVLSNTAVLDRENIPINTTIAGVEAYFPITIFQYALGLYDLYLLEKNPTYLNHFLKLADWALEHQQSNGMWDCMGTLKDQIHRTQSSMCQGEGASVLLRAYQETKLPKYYDAATDAIDFMLTSIEENGTCLYQGDHVIFQEYVSRDNLSVLNGWVFSIFGLLDYTLINPQEHYKTILEKSVQSICRMLPLYDRKYWSNYDLKKTIASPAYHDLHIQQLKLLYDLFEKEEFRIYAQKWRNYQHSKIYKILAMSVKLKQKIIKNKYYDINTSLIK